MTILAILLIVPVIVVLVIRMERQEPQLNLVTPVKHVGLQKQISATLTDPKSGLKRFWVAVIQNGKEITLYDKNFPATGWLRKGTLRSQDITFNLEPKKNGLTDGEAMLRMMVVDYSWRSWGKGNRTYKETDIYIDTQEPSIRVISNAHNISPGGSNAVIYELSESCQNSGVQIADLFFRGYPMGTDSDARHVALFALKHTQSKGTPMNLVATDLAGNQTTTSFPHYIKTKRFKHDTIRISDGFISRKLPEFKNDPKFDQLTIPLKQFLYINQDLRRQNNIVINQIMQKSESHKLWQGVFTRLPRSATRAGFGDKRTYRYGGKRVDQQTHLGIDLASISNAPIPAANAGKVVHTERLGIYGRTIVIDHGWGLFSMYAHLNSFEVQAGQQVQKGDIIGYTGTSGLAGGDHLHFSVLVQGVFVNPLEWWDPTWIQNNITSKLG
jgi:murein DD-endopeptidase MepM/ murein hydrolase activator NlpD